jgi:hypothetical protein
MIACQLFLARFHARAERLRLKLQNRVTKDLLIISKPWREETPERYNY